MLCWEFHDFRVISQRFGIWFRTDFDFDFSWILSISRCDIRWQMRRILFVSPMHWHHTKNSCHKLRLIVEFHLLLLFVVWMLRTIRFSTFPFCWKISVIFDEKPANLASTLTICNDFDEFVEKKNNFLWFLVLKITF